MTKRNENGDIVATWSTIAKAAEDEGMPPVSLRGAIKNKIVINGFVFTIPT